MELPRQPDLIKILQDNLKDTFNDIEIPTELKHELVNLYNSIEKINDIKDGDKKMYYILLFQQKTNELLNKCKQIIYGRFEDLLF